MSIDFTKLKSLADERGVVKQISDAQGAVLWSAVRSVVGTLYLRPSADISIVSGNKYPETLEYCYQAISEEVADGYVTYFGDEDSDTTSGSGDKLEVNVKVEGTFLLSLNQGASIIKVISAEYGIVANTTSDDATYPASGVTSKITVLGTDYNFTDDGYSTTQCPDEMISAINNYLATNGVLPEVTLYVYRKLNEETQSDKDLSASVKIDQVYLALECEYIE